MSGTEAELVFTGAIEADWHVYFTDLPVVPVSTALAIDEAVGVEYAKRNGKPVMIDFTGYGCVNCRKMELTV